ncbi:Protein BIG1 [Pleurotus pulmonarius]
MVAALAVLLAVLPVALAYSNTAPIVAWTSHRSAALETLPSGLKSGAALSYLLANNGACDSDAIVVVEHPGLHASDLRNLSPSSPLSLALRDSPSSRQYPYVPVDGDDVSVIVETVSSRCKSRLVTLTPGQPSTTLSPSEKYVINMRLPHLEGMALDRHASLSQHIDSLFELELSNIATSFPNHLVLYSGSTSALDKRQLPAQTVKTAAAVAPSGGILKRYQLLTPALISVLLVTLFVLFPLLFLGITALSSIQSPLRVEAPKGYSDRERKNQ